MNYIQRENEHHFLKMSKQFKAVLVTGARQIGKTTMLERLAAEHGRT
jgi:predicted AAA+ superfamily ATPase